MATTTGDVDLDGRPDLLVSRDDWFVSILYGAPAPDGSAPPFGCASVAGVSIAPVLVAVGDHDGDGDRDIAVSDGVDVHVTFR